MRVRFDRTRILFYWILAIVPLTMSVFMIWVAPPTMAHAWSWILVTVALATIGYWLYGMHRQRQRCKQSRQGTRSKAP